MNFQRGPNGDGRNRRPQLAADESIERVRVRIDLRGAPPEQIVRDAESARSRHGHLRDARYLGLSNLYHVFAYKRTAEKVDAPSTTKDDDAPSDDVGQARV